MSLAPPAPQYIPPAAPPPAPPPIQQPQGSPDQFKNMTGSGQPSFLASAVPPPASTAQRSLLGT
jgi:hypothetical protein